MFKVFSNHAIIGEFPNIDEACAAASAAVEAGGVDVHVVVPDSWSFEGWTPPA